MTSDTSPGGTEPPTGGGAAPARSNTWRRAKRAVVLLAAALCALVLAAGVDAYVLDARLRQVPVALPDDGPGSTWLLVGSDGFSHPHESPRFAGQRADVILLVHTGPPGASVVSVPRDLLLGTPNGGVERAALALDDGGPQQLVDGLCRTLGVAVGHLAVITRGGFAATVDAVGGVQVRVATPVRDPSVGLDLERAGVLHLDGAQALALVRSRHPQLLIDGHWTRQGEHAGAHARARNAGAVFAALRRAAADLKWHPLRLQQVLWTLTGAVIVDQDTGLSDLTGLLRGSGRLRVLPAAPLPNTIAVNPDEQTRAALAEVGYAGGCSPSG